MNKQTTIQCGESLDWDELMGYDSDTGTWGGYTDEDGVFNPGEDDWFEDYNESDD